MKSKNIGLLISVYFMSVLFIIKKTIGYPFLLINRNIVLINIIINVVMTYFLVTLFEFIILLIFLKQYHLKFKLFTYIPFIKLITYPFVYIFGYFFINLIYNFIFFMFYIVRAEIFTIYIEYILLLDKFEKSGVWISDKKLKNITLAGIIITNIIFFLFSFYPMGVWPPIFLHYPFKSY